MLAQFRDNAARLPRVEGRFDFALGIDPFSYLEGPFARHEGPWIGRGQIERIEFSTFTEQEYLRKALGN